MIILSDHTAPDSQFEYIQYDCVNRLTALKLDFNPTGKTKTGKVGFQTKGVTDGLDRIHGHLQAGILGMGHL